MNKILNTARKIKWLTKIFLTQHLQAHFLKHAHDVTQSRPNGPILIIAPHPDDETLGCGGVAALYKAAGERVRIVIVTDGCDINLLSHQTRDELIFKRRKEALQAAQCLGIPHEDVLFLAYPDGESQASISRIADDIASQIWLNPPSLILAPHGRDAHNDHRAVAMAVQKLWDENKIPCPVFEYPLWFWPQFALQHLCSRETLKKHRIFDISSVLDQKRKAIAAHESQIGQASWELLEAYGIAANLPSFELYFEKTSAPEESTHPPKKR